MTKKPQPTPPRPPSAPKIKVQFGPTPTRYGERLKPDKAIKRHK